MYSTCLFCTKDLGANEVIETLPVGRRIAFDSAQGRLWVVCRHCAKWNLVPFETRLESIDAGERVFRDTKTRYSTDNIGIARVKEGLELVRIGPALRPEFAAWRYGDKFGRRRVRSIVTAAALSTVGAVGVLGGAWLGATVAVGLQGSEIALRLGHYFLVKRKVIVRIPRRDAPPLQLTRTTADEAVIEWLPDGSWGICVDPFDWHQVFGLRPMTPQQKSAAIVGVDAERLMAGILTHTNRWEGKASHIQEAVELIEAKGDVATVLASVEAPSRFTRKDAIKNLPRTWRIAAEIALHEQSERKALEGELTLLEWQWQEADRLAKLADGLALRGSPGPDSAL